MTARNLLAILTLASCLFVGADAEAQKYRWAKVESVGMRFEVVFRLEWIPLKLGPGNLYKRARFLAKDPADHIQGMYEWYGDIYEFHYEDKDKKEDEEEEEEEEDDDKSEFKRKLKTLLEEADKRYYSYEEWLEDNEEDAVFLTRKKKKKGKDGMSYDFYEYHLPGTYSNGATAYYAVAVYKHKDREVAWVIRQPVTHPKKQRPHGKWKRYLDHMLKSGRILKKPKKKKEGVNTREENKEKWANTPKRKEALAKAKANIQGLKGWDYFTTQNYIILYAWNYEKPRQRATHHKLAKFYAERLEKMRALYQQYYPAETRMGGSQAPDKVGPDKKAGPITGPKNPDKTKPPTKGGKVEKKPERKPIEQPYSVFRLCATYQQFSKYGTTSGGVVGWFSPASKELVVFLGGDKMMGKGATETVSYHEGWHQYADWYFDESTLHRWFDEGHGDYFGSFRWLGGKWRYVGSKMRYASVKQMSNPKVNPADKYQPFKKITSWNRARFYGGRAAYYYAQAFSMVDFFHRGHKQGRKWKPEYGQILDKYRRVIQLERDHEKAVKEAFKGIDWQELEAAWQAWVRGPNFKKG